MTATFDISRTHSSKYSAFDVLVIGAGAGGLFTAALLAHRGYRTLVVERLDVVGGRASTRYIDGFAVNTGALGIELGNETEAVFNTVGAAFNVRPPRPAVVVRSAGRDYNISTGLLGLMVRGGTRLLSVLLRLLPALRARAGESTHQWASRFTGNTFVLGVVEKFVGSIFAAAPQQLPAALFLHYMTKKGAFKRFGFPPGGTITIWNTLVAALRRDGSEVWLGAEVSRLEVGEGERLMQVVVRRTDGEVRLAPRIVVSDIGPAATLQLCGAENLPIEYVRRIRATDRPSAIITIYFASREPLANFPGFACFSRTRRLCYAANFTPTCPENAPPGWHFYCGASVPQPAVGPFDEAAEIELLKADLLAEFPGFEAARIVDVVVTRDAWPAQRAIAGSDMPHTTPLNNLWNVGDGVKPWGNAATTACAETALVVAAEILERFPPVENTASIAKGAHTAS